MEKGIISTFSVRVRKSSSPFRVDCIKVLLYYKGNQRSLLTQGMYDLLIFSLVETNLGNLTEFTVEGRHAVSWAYSLSTSAVVCRGSLIAVLSDSLPKKRKLKLVLQHKVRWSGYIQNCCYSTMRNRSFVALIIGWSVELQSRHSRHADSSMLWHPVWLYGQQINPCQNLQTLKLTGTTPVTADSG